ncbi:MAG: hypothetical protein EZS28_003940 [Streblomastix strix]|uniref:Katanin p80 subunit C-terminal domain-containing protein n=1 Tax=Streblomastix strix TaxID=222440 RepID=A0A5J4X0F3_9EUKA|nr:MAG: hypothetical protein EZS28_003940 [Streblomastix strix]
MLNRIKQSHKSLVNTGIPGLSLALGDGGIYDSNMNREKKDNINDNQIDLQNRQKQQQQQQIYQIKTCSDDSSVIDVINLLLSKKNRGFSFRKQNQINQNSDPENRTIGAFDFDSVCNLLPRLTRLIFSPIEQHCELAIRTSVLIVKEFGQAIKIGAKMNILDNQMDDINDKDQSNENDGKDASNDKKLCKEEIDNRKKRMQQCIAAYAQLNEIFASAESLEAVYSRERVKTKVATETSELVQIIHRLIN